MDEKMDEAGQSAGYPFSIDQYKERNRIGVLLPFFIDPNRGEIEYLRFT